MTEPVQINALDLLAQLGSLDPQTLALLHLVAGRGSAVPTATEPAQSGGERRLDDLAAALGACPACWGEDPGCVRCRGHGLPGRFRPDRAAFEHYVMPLLNALQRRSLAGHERHVARRTLFFTDQTSQEYQP